MPTDDPPGATGPDMAAVDIIENCVGCEWTMHGPAQVRAGVNRPGMLERSAAGLTAKVLAERLAKLVRFGILEKQAFAESPPRVEYHLTPFGTRLVGLFDQIAAVHLEARPG